MGAGEELNLEAMNGTDTPFDGWIEVRFKLAGDDTTGGTKGTRVPDHWVQCYRRNPQSTQ